MGTDEKRRCDNCGHLYSTYEAGIVATIPARLCMKLAQERKQLDTLQWAYMGYVCNPNGTRLSWMEDAIDRQRKLVKLLTDLRAMERPADCPQKHGHECADPEGGACLWNGLAIYEV